MTRNQARYAIQEVIEDPAASHVLRIYAAGSVFRDPADVCAELEYLVRWFRVLAEQAEDAIVRWPRPA